MGFDKIKALNAAEKFLSQGKIPAAIQEYRKIVERDPADFTALNTLGDLHVRTKNPAEAIPYFLRVADHYREQGFALKAIAVYKKISRLAPEAAGVSQHLARLYEQQGLYVEARAQYLSIADAAARGGRAVESLEALRRIADLDPRNVEIRTRLADGYTREGMMREAAGAYSEAGGLLLSAGKSREALDAYRHAHKLEPASHAVLHGLVSASTAVGETAEAARVLEQSVESAPDDLELRAMLARTYVEAEDAPAAERATDALVAAEHTNYTLWFEVARLYLKRRAVDDGVRMLARATEPALTGRQERAVLELLDAALAIDPEQVEALKLVLRIHTWHRDDERARVTLEQLADAARKHGQTEEERRALEHLVRLVPFDQGYHERLSRLGAADGAPPVPDFSTAARADAPDQTFARADAPAPDDAFAFNAEAAPAATREHEPSSLETAAFASLADVHDSTAFDFVPASQSAPADAQPAAPAAEFEWNSVAEGNGHASAFDAREAAGGNGFETGGRDFKGFDPSSSFADLNAELEGGGAQGQTAAHDSSAPAADSFAFALERNGFDEPAPRAADAFAPDPALAPPAASASASASAASAAPSAPRADEGRLQSLLRQELESVDFYLEQGYTDIARDTLDMLERQYGTSAETTARRERLGGHAPAEPTGPAPEFEHEGADGETFVDLSAVEYSSEERAARASEEFRIDEQSFVARAEETAAERPAPPAPEALAAAEIVAEEIASPKPPAPAQSARRAADPHLASLFGEFLDDETEEPAPSHDSDFETHYNLGLAYKEMGLWDEAVEQFQKASDLTSPADGTPRYLECCNMLAHCLAQKGMPRAAVIWLKRALALPTLTEDEGQALRYDLAAAYEQAGDIDRAIDTFSEVYAVNVSYRGVAERLRDLQSMKVVNR